MKQTRIDFLKAIGFGVIISQTNNSFAKSKVENFSLKLGLASYTLREYSLDEVIKHCKRLNINQLALKSMHLPLDSSVEFIKETVKKVRDAGITPYGVGVVYMKTEAEVSNAFAYAQAANIPTIIGVPNHELLPFTEKKVKETGIRLAIHNHGPGDKVYPTPDSVYEKIKDLDKNIGLCIDIGHVVRLGLDPVKFINKYKNRLFDLHIKDVDKVAENGESVEIGRGVIDITSVLKTLQKINYQGVLGIEYEKDGKNAIFGLTESVGYLRGILKMI
ncbi:MAG: sugar phosphate isomerase/epimerase [Bacteroidota bacterium]